jgi:hypothetical protein
MFNLSLINSGEEILKSDVFINRRYIKEKLVFKIKYFLYSTKMSNGNKRNQNETSFSDKEGDSESVILDLDSLLTRNNFLLRKSWQPFNLIDSLNHYINSRKSDNTANSADELILIMECQNRVKKYRDYINPYLIIYSHDNEMNLKSFFQTKMSLKLNKEEKVELKKGKFIKKLKLNNKLKFKLLNFIDVYELINDNNDNKGVKTAQIYFNYYSDSNSHNKLNKKEKRQINQSYLPSPFDVLLKNANYSSEIMFPLQKNNYSQQQCELKSILIDFDDLNLSDWIIEPKQFQSNYCSGQCTSLNDKILNHITNYAYLQTFLNKLSINEYNTPPSVCCSAVGTKSLPIHYVDVNSVDHVIKILPDMIVNECACR